MSESWKKPSWYTTYYDPNAVTDEQLAAWKQQAEECDRHNRDLAAKVAKLTEDYLEAVRGLLGEEHPSLKTLKRLKAIAPPQFESSYSSLIANVQAARKRKADAEAATAAERELKEKTARAILWLQQRGKVLLADFTLENAIQVADDIAFDEEVARLKAADGFHSFSGQNCDGPCEGWNGEDHRCQCGNRRVAWVRGYGHSFENPYAVAEAW